jgi:hypothetical protein
LTTTTTTTTNPQILQYLNKFVPFGEPLTISTYISEGMDESGRGKVLSLKHLVLN